MSSERITGERPEREGGQQEAGSPGGTGGASRVGWLSPRWPLLFVLLVWAGERLIGERWWVTTWALYLPQPLFLAPSLLLMALALLLRRWRALAGQAAVALLGMVLLFSGAYRLSAPPRRGDLRVMTWNVEGLQGDPEGVLAAIRQEAPDALLVEEISFVRGPDPVPWLSQHLPGWSEVHGRDVAIFSPHPLGPATRHWLGPVGMNRADGRIGLEASVQVQGRGVDLIVVHFSTALPRPARERAWHHPRHNMEIAAAVRAEQTDRLAAVVRRAGRPLVVGGDFNSPPGSYAERRMSSLLESAFAAGGSGFGWSFPSPFPVLRIDHLFASRDLRVLDCRVLPLRASDHRPVVADLAWR